MTLGIDIGGTNLSFGLVEDSKVTEGFSVPSFAPGASLEETLEYLASKISEEDRHWRSLGGRCETGDRL